MKSIFLLSFLSTVLCVSAQTKNNIVPAHFGDTDSSLVVYLRDNVEYPYNGSKTKITGNVYVLVDIDKNGKVTNATLVQGIDKDKKATNVTIVEGGAEYCNIHAVAVLKSMPNWIPATKKNKKIESKVTVVVPFYPTPVKVLKPTPIPTIKDEIYIQVEEQAEFPGGEDALISYINRNIKYPSEATGADIQGKVKIEFIVEKDGSVSNIVCKKDIGGGCGEEGKRIVANFPNWKPARNNNTPVRVKKTIPINFQLR